MMTFAILGYGFVGAIHAATLQKVKNAKLVAVVENDKSKWNTVTKGNIDVNGVATLQVPIYERIEAMKKGVQPDCLSSCLPTYLHRSFTEAAMAARMHVVCEKPMALTLGDCDAMIAASERFRKQLFVAQCIRFWPEYAALKKLHDSAELGAPRSFRFHRLSGMPSWGGEQSWFFQEEKSGGCLFDLHVHDVDFAHFLLGAPTAVHASGVKLAYGVNAAVVSQFRYDNNVTCTIEGSWLYHSGFQMSFSAVYENGQVEYNSSETPTLKLYRPGSDEAEPLAVPESDGYIEQYNYFVECLQDEKKPTLITPASTRTSIKLALAEKESIDAGEVVLI